MWSDDVRRIVQEDPSDDEDVAIRVKHANLKVYDEVSNDHSEHTNGLHSYVDVIGFLKSFAGEQQLPVPDGQKRIAVDVGCASGVGMDVGTRQYDEVVGVDISLGNLKMVAERGYTAVLADSERLPFAEGSLDMVSCFAAMHHFPTPHNFTLSAHRCLREGGVLVTGADPSKASLHFGPLTSVIWDLRKPVYRLLSRTGSKRFYMHSSIRMQEVNDLAEIQRTEGGFSQEELRDMFAGAGFGGVKVFFGIDPSGQRKFDKPSWKMALLKLTSGQNPLRRSNWVSLSAVGVK
jgi:SAM-dependent methyltransferase